MCRIAADVVEMASDIWQTSATVDLTLRNVERLG